MRLITLALLSSLALIAGTQTYGLDPVTPLKSDEPPTPLDFTVRLISNLADAKAAQQEASPPLSPPRTARREAPPELSAFPILVRITNHSNKDVVLPNFCREQLNFSFDCSSPDALIPPPITENFMLPLECVVLHPRQSTAALDYIKEYIYFLRSGHYEVHYGLSVGYAYADHPIPGKEKDDLISRYRQDHVALVHGKLDILVRPDQVYKP